MPRLYHSPSSIELASRCRRSWALRYIDGFRDPRIEWADIESGRITLVPRDARPGPNQCTPAQRSQALGVAGHTVLEDWYSGRPPNWRSLPGAIMVSGVHLLPHPDQCYDVDPEGGVGDVALPPSDDPDRPQTAMIVHGVPFAGFRDLIAYPDEPELWRLLCELPDGSQVFDRSGGWLLVDYKTTSSIANWAKSADDLRRDVQRCLYGLDVMRRTGLDENLGRWVYFETKQVRRAIAVDTLVTRDHALGVLEPAALLARELDQIERSQDAPCNYDACMDYGGRSCHASLGGPCDARRSTASLIQARTPRKSKEIMSIQDARAKFDAAKKLAAGGGAAAAVTDASVPTSAAATAPSTPPPVAPAASAPPAVAVAPASPARRGRPAAVAPPPAAEPEPPPPAKPVDFDALEAAVASLGPARKALMDANTVVIDLEVDLGAAREAQASAQAAVDALVAQVREASGS